MKRENFGEVFLLAAVVIFIAAGRNLWSSIILMLASLYVLCDVISSIWKEIHHADRKTKQSDDSNSKIQ